MADTATQAKAADTTPESKEPETKLTSTTETAKDETSKTSTSEETKPVCSHSSVFLFGAAYSASDRQLNILPDCKRASNCRSYFCRPDRDRRRFRRC